MSSEDGQKLMLHPMYASNHDVDPFPTLWIIAQREAARQVAEVGCERFFDLSGDIASPRRSRLGMRTYKCLAMMASIIQNVYIDNDWVAQQYIEQG